VRIRTYHDLTSPDRSGLADQIGAQRRRVAERLHAVRRVVAVMSGKGGVGKSFVTARLARAAAAAGRAVGVLDADLDGPTVARLLGTRDGRFTIDDETVRPVVADSGVTVVSMDHLLADGQPLAFRGPRPVWHGALETAALREFLADVAWGELDLLLVDLPPGAQRYRELVDLLPVPPALLVVTIATPESRDAVRRALRAAVDGGATGIGIVENMVGGWFRGDAADALAAEFGLPVLARVPFDPPDAVWIELASRV
jgi:ATP-binding protein involved in chromosome partitioning